MNIEQATSIVLWQAFNETEATQESALGDGLLDLWQASRDSGQFSLTASTEAEKKAEIKNKLKGPVNESISNAVDKIVEAAREAAARAAKKPGGEEQTPTTSVPPAFPSYRLILEATKVEVVHVTKPRSDEDEFVLTGGYAHGNGGKGTFDQWSAEINEGDAAIDLNPHVLENVEVPRGSNINFDATIILQEEDWAGTTLAAALGTFISLALTGGVEIAIRYLRTNGLPAELSDAARDVLKEFGITGIRSWFEELAGPEMFQIVVLRANTSWASSNDPVKWRSWIDFTPNTKITNPHYSEGPNTHVGDVITFKEAKITRDSNGNPTMRVVNDGGEYKLNFQFRVEGSGA